MTGNKKPLGNKGFGTFQDFLKLYIGTEGRNRTGTSEETGF